MYLHFILSSNQSKLSLTKWVRYEYTDTRNDTSYFIRNDAYSKSKQYVAFKFSIYIYYVSSSCFAQIFVYAFENSNVVLYLVSLRSPNTLDKPN